MYAGEHGATISDMTEWTPDLSTGVALLDEQHREIYQWLAELQSAADDERTLFGVYSLTRLKHYTRAHFAAEEALMETAGYPGLAEHAAEHATFRARLDQLQLTSIGQDISKDTVDFLTNWLTSHITTTDMAYVPHLKKPR